MGQSQHYNQSDNDGCLSWVKTGVAAVVIFGIACEIISEARNSLYHALDPKDSPKQEVSIPAHHYTYTVVDKNSVDIREDGRPNEVTHVDFAGQSVMITRKCCGSEGFSLQDFSSNPQNKAVIYSADSVIKTVYIPH